MLRVFILFLSLSISLCFGAENLQSHERPDFTNRSIRGDGVLANISDKDFGFRALKLARGLKIHNIDGSLYATLHADKKSHEMYFLKGNKKFTPRVRAFFPEYDILVMDAKNGGGQALQVFIDGAWRKVISDQLFFYRWDDFLVNFASFIPLSKKPFVVYKKKRATHGVAIDGANTYSFVFTEIDGDWAFVSCDMDCEGCPESGVIEGWIKWKNIDQLAVDLRYVC